MSSTLGGIIGLIIGLALVFLALPFANAACYKNHDMTYMQNVRANFVALLTLGKR